MKAIKQTAIIIGLAMLFKGVATQHIAMVMLIATLVLSAITGALMTVLSMAGEKPTAAIPCWIFLGLDLLMAPANEIPGLLCAVALGLLLGCSAIYIAMLFATNDIDNDDT